jgi:hypothetical protein
MAPTFSLAVVLAFLLAVVQSVELTSSKSQFRFLLNGDMIAKAKAGRRKKLLELRLLRSSYLSFLSLMQDIHLLLKLSLALRC